MSHDGFYQVIHLLVLPNIAVLPRWNSKVRQATHVSPNCCNFAQGCALPRKHNLAADAEHYARRAYCSMCRVDVLCYVMLCVFLIVIVCVAGSEPFARRAYCSMCCADL